MAALQTGRRAAWALPPQPPEAWVGGRARGAALIATGLVLVVPLRVLLEQRDAGTAALAAVHVAAGLGALVAVYVLHVQASVTGDSRLRWVAGGYAALVALALTRSAGLPGPGAGAEVLSREAALSLVLQLALPLVVLASPLARRGLHLLAVPLAALLALGAVVVLAPAALPGLVADDGSRSGLLRGLDGGLALLAVAAAGTALRLRAHGRTGPWAWVAVGLVLAPAVGLLRALSEERASATWWAAAVVEALALAVPAVGLALHTSAGYRRQVRRWHQLERQVRRLRAASPLIPGLSTSPEDDEGLPSAVEVRAVIDARLVRIALQPVVQLSDGAVIGSEALSRFGGRVPTYRWFRAAGLHGLDADLERVTLAAALDLLPTLPPAQFLAVNVSPAALADAAVLDLLHRSDPSRLVVEVTEHEAVEDYPGTRAELARLRRRGARIAVDDTGAGHASLRHVLMLQPDVVKLDISLTRGVEDDERQQRLVTALLTFAEAVGFTVLAEGIETQPQLEALRDLGVECGQGWHLGVPALPGGVRS